MRGRPSYGAKKTGKYASKREANVAANLWALSEAGEIEDLEEQVRFELIPGRDGIRGITYVADFAYYDKLGAYHVADAKGFKTEKYLLKKKMIFLLMGITIEEL